MDGDKSVGDHNVWKDWVKGDMSMHKAAFKTEQSTLNCMQNKHLSVIISFKVSA